MAKSSIAGGIFLKEGIKSIRTVGTVCSTSRFVAKAMAPKIQRGDAPKAVVELGVGTGSVTKEILKHLRPNDCYIGVEANRRFLEICRAGLCVGDQNVSVHLEHGLAQDVKKILKKHKIEKVDEVVCTVPFRILPKRDTLRILSAVKGILKEGGHFIYIRYLLAPENREIALALAGFSVVERKLVMRNIPPAEIIKMRAS